MNLGIRNLVNLFLELTVLCSTISLSLPLPFVEMEQRGNLINLASLPSRAERPSKRRLLNSVTDEYESRTRGGIEASSLPKRAAVEDITGQTNIRPKGCETKFYTLFYGFEDFVPFVSTAFFHNIHTNRGIMGVLESIMPWFVNY